MQLIRACVNNPVKVTVGVLLVALFGTIALMRMPMQLVPEVLTPTITVETRWPGASPQEVEREIVQEQEEQLKSVEGVIRMTSESIDSQGKVALEFNVGTDLTAALLKVNTRLQQVREYPEEADEPVINTSSSSDQAIAWFILRPRLPTNGEIEAFQKENPTLREALEPVRRAGHSGLRERRLRTAAERHPEVKALLPLDLDMPTLLRFTEDIVEARFERVDGVSNSNVYGGREDELQIVIDPERLADRRLTIQDVRTALRGQNNDVSGGDFWEGKRRYVVRTLGQFKSLADVENVVLRRSQGGSIYLRDVADVRLGYKKATGMVRNFGATVLAVNVIRERGANVMEIMDGLYEARAELNAGVLKERGLQLDQVYDETEYIHSAVDLVRDNLMIGAALTVLILLVFLRSPRSTLVIALAIPTSIIGTFLLLQMLGQSLNVVSLAGLAFAIGMLVDNAVVVLENIFRRYEAGERRLEAAVNGTKEVWGAVLASTLTTLAVFLPIVFIEEEAGQLFRVIALAVSFSVGLSLVVSITVIPTAAARILPKHTTDGRENLTSLTPAVLRPLFAPFDRFGRAFVHVVLAGHRWLQQGLVRQLALIGILVVGSILLTILLIPKVEYLPSGNRNLAIGIVIPPTGYNLDELVAMGEGVEEALSPYWTVDPDDPKAQELDGPAIRHFFFVAFGRSVFMGLRAHDPMRASELPPMIRRVGGGIPGTFIVAKQSSLFEQGLTGGRSIDIEITGPDLGKLIGIGRRVIGQVGQVVPGSQPIPKPSLALSNPEVHIEPRWERARDVGISAADLGYVVDSLVDGAYAGDYFVGGDKIDITLVGRSDLATGLEDLRELPIATPTGDLVPLRSLADVRLSSGPEQVNRSERVRTITIQVSPPETVALEDALDKIREQIVTPIQTDGSLGPGYDIRLSGTADKLYATWGALSFNVLLALVITYLLLAALFESWLFPFIIILSVPLGAVGGFLGLQVLNQFVPQTLDVLTMLGFVILIGTVVNNAILIVHQSLVHIREEGQEASEAVLNSVRTRIRPIFMTVLTTVCGLLPLVLFPGAGSELYRGLGSVLIGGLIVSTVFTLFLVPTLFRVTLGAKSRLARIVTGGAAERP